MNTIMCYLNSKQELKILNERLFLLDKYKDNIISEKKQLNHLIEEIKCKIDSIENELKNLTGIEYELFSEIVFNGLNVSKAVEKVAEKEEKDVSTIWKNYYPKIKNKIEKLK